MDEATMAEIEARANAATPGPWRSGGFYGLARANDGDTAGWRHGAALPLGRCTFCRDAAGPCPATLMHRGEYDAAPRAYHAHWIAAEPGEGWQGISSDAAALAITGNYDYDRGGVCSTPEDSAFIVHARADVPALVAEVRRLTAALDAVTTEHAAALDAARREGAEEVMAMSNPWPLHDVLAKLTEASRALLNRYNYDGHGWELILAACESADAIIARIHARTRALPLDAPGGGS